MDYIADVIDKMQVSGSCAKGVNAYNRQVSGGLLQILHERRSWIDPVNYDLILNSPKAGWNHCVGLIKEYLNMGPDVLGK